MSSRRENGRQYLLSAHVGGRSPSAIGDVAQARTDRRPAREDAPGLPHERLASEAVTSAAIAETIANAKRRGGPDRAGRMETSCPSYRRQRQRGERTSEFRALCCSGPRKTANFRYLHLPDASRVLRQRWAVRARLSVPTMTLASGCTPLAARLCCRPPETFRICRFRTRMRRHGPPCGSGRPEVPPTSKGRGLPT